MRPLYYSIRQWAQYKELTGGVHPGGPRLTHYALAMLVFHYLTVCEPWVLPTVKTLAGLAGNH